MPPFLNRDYLRLDWQKTRARRALPCMVPIAACLAAGLLCNNPLAGMVAAGGAFSVGFGSFQLLGQSRVAPMWWATLGMAASTLGGSLVGHAGIAGTLFNAAWAGFGGGMLLALGPGSSWVGLQCGVFAIVASGYPVGLALAGTRALLILAGGTLQTLFMVGVWKVRSPYAASQENDPFPGFLSAVPILRRALRERGETFQYAVRQGLTVATAAELARYLELASGYWVPMTALIVLKPGLRETFQRGLERVAGTLLGAALATLLVHALRLDPVTVAGLTVLFAWLAYTLINVNYGVFAVFLTGYIVFLLDFGGLSTQVVAARRAVNTALGGGLALLSYVTVLLRLWFAPRSLPEGMAARLAAPDTEA